MQVPDRFASLLEKLARSTGVDAETYLTMALQDWFDVSAPTYQPTNKSAVCKISKPKTPSVLLSLVTMQR